MLKYRVIPCLDVKDGRVVKGIQFRNLRDAGCPVEQAQMYESQGADEIVVLDVSATTEDRATAVHTIKAVRQRLSIPLAVGGGIRSGDDAAALLDAGADKVAVNSAAVARPELVTEIADRFGSQCTVIAIDAARSDMHDRATWVIVVRSGMKREAIDAIEWARRCEQAGAGEVLLTSWDRDGTGRGYDLELLKAMTSAVSIPVIASGGASSPADIITAIGTGAQAVLAASIFHDGLYSVKDVKCAMRNAGLEVRL